MTKSPFYVERKPVTRAAELRENLSQLESLVGQLGHGLGERALHIPPLFEIVSTALSTLQADGREMRAEKARFEAVSAELERKASLFLDEIGGAGVLQDARRARQPDQEQWWWFLDDRIASQRREQLRRLALGAATVVVVLLMLYAAYEKFLAPDPITRERMAHEQAAQRLVQEGDLAGALREVEQALAVAPGTVELIVFKGVLQEGLGQGEAAEEAFTEAESLLNDRERFLRGRAEAYLFLGQPEAALGDAEAVVALNPESAGGHLLLARAHERLGNYPPAAEAYERAAILAEAQGNESLAATARFNLGILMQRPPDISQGNN